LLCSIVKRIFLLLFFPCNFVLPLLFGPCRIICLFLSICRCLSFGQLFLEKKFACGQYALPGIYKKAIEADLANIQKAKQNPKKGMG